MVRRERDGTKDPGCGRILQAFGIPYLFQYLQRADIDMVREVYRTYGLCHYSNEGADEEYRLVFISAVCFYGRSCPSCRQGTFIFYRTYPPYVRMVQDLLHTEKMMISTKCSKCGRSNRISVTAWSWRLPYLNQVSEGRLSSKALQIRHAA